MSSPSGTTRSRLCAECHSFFARAPKAWNGSTIRSFRDFQAGSEDVQEDAARRAFRECVHVSSFAAVALNANNNYCHLCTMLWAKLKANPGFRAMINDLDTTSLMGFVQQKLQIAVFEGFRDGYHLRFAVGPAGAPPVVEDSLAILTRVKANMDGVGEPLGTSTSSEESLGLAKAWLNRCRTHHNDCKPLVEAAESLPSRLLDVGSDETSDMVSLHITRKDAGDYQYLTLSHCWGKTSRLLLIEENLDDFRQGLALERLAPTFRDAIHITRRLGFKFIWIDCLCIVQNSPQDWETEAGKMAGIYGNAACCIAASASADSHGGCFVLRNPLEVQPIRFDGYPFVPNWETESSKPLFIARTNDNVWNSCRGPLDGRGWILQEQLLSPRTLHYAKDQLFWECRTSTACETWPSGLPEDILASMSDGRSKAVYNRNLLQSQEVSSGHASEDPEFLYRRWEKIIGWYTARSLTKQKDKLPALAGIADVMMGLSQDRYLAGLWKNSLLRGLAWCALPESRSDVRPAEYRAPSWTWASVDGAILYQDVDKHSREAEACIHYCEVIYVDERRFWPVSNGSLDISGLCRESTLTEDSNKPTRTRLADELTGGFLDDEVEVFPDTHPRQLVGKIFLLQLYRAHSLNLYGSPLGRNVLHGLVLSPTGQLDEYRRIGYFKQADRGYSKIAKAEWTHYFVDGWTKRRIRII